jgi:phosphoribosylformylglycinamidine synthase I
MKKEEVKVCVLRVGGTNCDAETKRSIEELGVNAKVCHINTLVNERSLLDFDALVLPGGFSFGDYVRAGAVLAKGFSAELRRDLERFVDDGRPILGICNGFQVLVESGLLPGFHGIGEYPEAALATNMPIGYRCRWTYLTHENQANCIFTKEIPKGKVVRMPVAHAEGRFLFQKQKEDAHLKRLYDNDQLVFRYCKQQGEAAEGEYPANPTGSFHDIAGICNPEGTIFGLMPHPERAYYGWQLPDWTRLDPPEIYGDGRLIFESMVNYLSRKF